MGSVRVADGRVMDGSHEPNRPIRRADMSTLWPRHQFVTMYPPRSCLPVGTAVQPHAASCRPHERNHGADDEDRFCKRGTAPDGAMEGQGGVDRHFQGAAIRSDPPAVTQLRWRPPSRLVGAWWAGQGGLRLCERILRLLETRASGHGSAMGHFRREPDHRGAE